MPAPTQELLKIDGSTGEGGGQIIRTALSLSMLTGTPIEIINIRTGRAKPGLMRQHLVCVQASQEISNAAVTGAQMGSTTFSFTPNAIQSGDYTFDIGSAGSTSLVLQTLLPALLFANTGLAAQSTVTIKGGTHNPLAPTTDFLTGAFVPALAKLGMHVDLELQQVGFAPIGGGTVKATITPFCVVLIPCPLHLLNVAIWLTSPWSQACSIWITTFANVSLPARKHHWSNQALIRR